MQHLKKYFFIVGSLVFFQLGYTSYAQEKVKKNVRMGFEYGSFLIANNGSYEAEPGFLLGYFTGVKLFSDSSKSIFLDIEFNYKNTILYNLGVSHIIIDRFKYQDTYDEKYGISTLEIGLLPEYRFALNNNVVIGIYAGGAVGVGSSQQQHNLVSHIKIDSAQYPMWLLDGPYDGNSQFFIGTYTINYGTNIYYDWLVCDVRFSILKDLINPGPKSINQFYVLFGILL